MSENVLYTVDNVSFAYDAAPVLLDLNLKLYPGKFYGIVGPNGCGKTTFLDLLTGNKKTLQGKVRYKGQEMSSYSKQALARQLALVPQEFDTGFGFTVEEVVLMGRHPYIKRFSSPSEEDWRYVDQAMESIGISDLRDRYTNTLSGGQKQRAVVARALAQNTEVLLFDEATSSLDVKYTLQIFNIGRQLVRNDGKTVIAVIHNLNLAAAYCDELIFMKEGQLVCHGGTEATMTAKNISEVFDVCAQVTTDPFNQTRQVSYQYWEQ